MTVEPIPTSTGPFVFWKPVAGMALSINEDEQYILPDIPMPLRPADLPQCSSEMPSERVLGEGIYEYLRSHPDADHAGQYADILRCAYPFLISDMASQLLLLDLRPTDPVALRGKIALLKILLHLDSDNFGLQHKLGVAYFHLAVHPQSKVDISDDLRSARQWLEKARRSCPGDPGNLSYIGQVCYMTGNYHQARLYWQSILGQVNVLEGYEQLQQRFELLNQGIVPVEPLQEQLNQMARARELFGSGDVEQAHCIVENLVSRGDLLREMPSAELCYFIGICREKMNDDAGAYEALTMATGLDDRHEQACAALQGIAARTQKGA